MAAPAWLAMTSKTLNFGSAYVWDADWTNQPVRFYRLRSP